MKKRILFINYLIWRPELPNFSHMYELFSAEYDGVMLHLSGGKEEKRSGGFIFLSTPYRANLFLRQFYYILFCLKKTFQQKPFDYIIAYDPLICGIIGLLAKWITGGKLIIEVNTNHFEGISIQRENLKAYIKRFFMKISLRKAEAVKFVSQNLKVEYERIFNLSSRPKQIAAFYSFISTQVFKKTGPTHDNYLLLVGSPFPIKGVDVLIRAFQLITSDYPHIKLKIIGHYNDRSAFDKLVNNNPRIIILPGQEYDKIINEIERCRIFVLPSRTEGLPRVLIEAMACAKPVIGSNIGGIPEAIQDGVTGYLFPVEDEKALADRIKSLLDNPQLAWQMGEAGYERAKKYFSPQRYFELYSEFLKKIL